MIGSIRPLLTLEVCPAFAFLADDAVRGVVVQNRIEGMFSSTAMSRRAIVLVGLMLLPYAGARAEQRVAAHVVAASPALAVSQRSAILELAGSWSGHDWGELVLNADGTGTYTDTFGPGPGQMRFDRVGDHSYKGIWRESDQRSGTMVFELSSDGQTIAGVWTPDPSSTIGGKTGGAILWTRK